MLGMSSKTYVVTNMEMPIKIVKIHTHFKIHIYILTPTHTHRHQFTISHISVFFLFYIFLQENIYIFCHRLVVLVVREAMA